MEVAVRYRSVVHDNLRWEGFAFRDGDIVISTPPKCGTTWTQMICALLIFQTPELPRPLDLISPWLDQSLRNLEEVVADLDAQEHRRFIKTHTPLDGLPFDERVTYICVGRDPRDVAMSWDNHMTNLDIPAFLALREEAVGLDDLPELMPEGPPVRPEDERERFWHWVETASDALDGLLGTTHHLSTFWQVRTRPNVVLLHYGDLKADLKGQMRRLASRLDINVAENRWDELVQAATFEDMRRRAKESAPNATKPIWIDTGRFFNKGTSGQWRHLLDEEDLRRYESRVNELVEPELSAWMHQGPINRR
jgi:hypothetical protein